MKTKNSLNIKQIETIIKSSLVDNTNSDFYIKKFDQPYKAVNYCFQLFSIEKYNKNFDKALLYISIAIEICLMNNLNYNNYFNIHNITKKSLEISNMDNKAKQKREELDSDGKKLLKIKKYSKALETFIELEKIERATLFDSHLGQAEALINFNEYDKALNILEKGFEKNKYLRYLPLIARIHRLKGDIKKFFDIIFIYNNYDNNTLIYGYLEIFYYYIDNGDQKGAYTMFEQCQNMSLRNIKNNSVFEEEMKEISEDLFDTSNLKKFAEEIYKELKESLKFTIQNILQISEEYHGRYYNEIMIELTFILYQQQFPQIAKNLIKVLELDNIEMKKYNKGVAKIQQNKKLYKHKAKG